MGDDAKTRLVARFKENDPVSTFHIEPLQKRDGDEIMRIPMNPGMAANKESGRTN